MLPNIFIYKPQRLSGYNRNDKKNSFKLNESSIFVSTKRLLLGLERDPKDNEHAKVGDNEYNQDQRSGIVGS